MGFFSSIGKLFGGALSKGAQSAISGIPGAGVNAGLGIISSSIQNHMQQKNAKYWADYNSPASQMARLREAGLNPNLVYGNGAVATADGATSVDAPKMSSKYDSLSQMMALQNLDAQRALLESQKALNDANAKKAMQETSNLVKEGDRIGADINVKNSQYRLNSVNAEIAEITRDVASKWSMKISEQKFLKSEAEATAAKVAAQFAPKLKDLEVRFGVQKINTLVAQASAYSAQVREVNKRIKVLEEQQRLYNSQANVSQINELKQGLEVDKANFEKALRDVGVTNPKDYSPEVIQAYLHGDNRDLGESLLIGGSQLSDYIGKDIISPIFSFLSLFK